MLKKVLFLMMIFCVFTSPRVLADMLEEANDSFTYEGKPIHPRLVHEFSNWLSDGTSPVVTSLDVISAFDTDEYPYEEVKKREDWWYAEKEEMDGDIRLYESFDYRWYGKMENGIHVVATGESGGGSGFFMDLMFIRFSEGEILIENTPQKQLIMSIVGMYTLGDRYGGDIKVHENRVFISADKNRYSGVIEEDIELAF